VHFSCNQASPASCDLEKPVTVDFIPETNTQRTELSQGSTFKHIFGQKFIHAMAIFVLVYVGVEVTIGYVTQLDC